MATQKPITPLVATNREGVARLALRMAAQARKFGARVAEIREDDRGWTQRQLAERMNDLGDRSINTNQVSRYENGHTFPGERRQEVFAEALETTVADLLQGPLAEREEQSRETPDPFAQPAGADERLDQLADQISELQAGIAAVVRVLADDAERRAEAAESRAEGRPPAVSPHEPERRQRLEAARHWAGRQRHIRDGG